MAPPIFPTLAGITWPVKRTPLWNTLKQEMASGAITRVPLYSYPRYQYELSFELLRADANAEWQTLEAFWNGVNGGGAMFLFNDLADNTVAAQPFGEGDGITNTFQLVRSLGGFTVPVFTPNIIAGIKIGGTPTSAYTLGSYGQIVFTTAPGAGQLLTWDGSFYWPCYFDEDSAAFSQFAYRFWELQSVKFTSAKL